MQSTHIILAPRRQSAVYDGLCFIISLTPSVCPLLWQVLMPENLSPGDSFEVDVGLDEEEQEQQEEEQAQAEVRLAASERAELSSEQARLAAAAELQAEAVRLAAEEAAQADSSPALRLQARAESAARSIAEDPVFGALRWERTTATPNAPRGQYNLTRLVCAYGAASCWEGSMVRLTGCEYSRRAVLRSCQPRTGCI